MFPIRNVEDLQNLNEAVSLQNQVKFVRLPDKLCKQNFHKDMEEVFEPLTDTLKNTSENETKSITKNSIKSNQAIENLNNKLLEIMNDRGSIIATYLLSPLAKITNPENSTQFKLVKAHNSNRVNDLLIKNTIPITLQDNLLTFRDSGKVFELKGDLLKMITNKNYNVDFASLQDKKLMYDFAKEMNFDAKAKGNKSTRDRILIKLFKSPRTMASGISKTIILSSDPNELCDRLKLVVQEKHGGKNSNLIDEEIVTIIHKLLEDKCIS